MATGIRCAELLGVPVFGVADGQISWRAGPRVAFEDQLRPLAERVSAGAAIGEMVWATA